MKTARGALRNTIPGYAGGGLIDGLKRAVGMAPAETMREKFAREDAARKPALAQPVAAPITPTPTLNTPAPMGSQGVIDKRMAAAGASRGAKIKPNMAKEAGKGGMIKGPGTPTSDSIPAKVVDTGEPIKVATGERIVSKKQDAFLQKMADEMGFDSVDAMLEAGTGEPVGPTMKYDNDSDERGGPSDMDGDEPIKHAGLGALIDNVKRAVGVLPPETMIQKIARQDAERAQKQQSAPAVQTTAQPQAIAAPMGSQSVLDDREKRAGLANGGQVDKNMELEANKGLFTGGDPYAIPGYTPGMIQRGGMGMAGYNPLTQGQTVSVPTNDGSEATPEQIKKMEAMGFACGGAIRKHMATGGIVGQKVKMPFISTGYDHSKVQSLGPGLRGAAGGASPEDLHNDALAKAQALAAARASGAMPTPASEASGRDAYLGALEKGSPSYFQQATPSTSQAKMAASSALEGMYQTPAAPAAPVPAAPAAPAPTFQPSKDPAGYAGGALPPAATSPAAPGAIARLSNADGKDVGHGVTRFDVPGKSPLFTNMTDAAGMASNEKLINRGPVSEQNLGALRGIQQRQDIGDLARSQKSQYDAEVAGARAINTAPERYDPESGARALNDLTSPTSKAIHNLASRDRTGKLVPGVQQAIDAIIKQTLSGPQVVHVEDQRNATTQRGQDVIARGQAVQAGALRANQKMAQDKFAQDSKGAAIDQQGKVQIQALQNALLAEQDPAKRQLIEDNLRAVQGKYEKAVPQKYTVYNLPDTVDANGQVVRGGQGALDSEGKPIDIRPQPKPIPKPGDVVSGHKFKGGNPADQKNWEKV